MRPVIIPGGEWVDEFHDFGRGKELSRQVPWLLQPLVAQSSYGVPGVGQRTSKFSLSGVLKLDSWSQVKKKIPAYHSVRDVGCAVASCSLPGDVPMVIASRIAVAVEHSGNPSPHSAELTEGHDVSIGDPRLPNEVAMANAFIGVGVEFFRR
jgi:hypothetical protein